MITAENAPTIVKAIGSPISYVERYLKIRTETGKLIDFRLNPVQRKYMKLKKEAILAGRPPRFLVLKARREGITTLEQALSFYSVATRTNQQVVTVAHKKESTEMIFRMVNLFYDKLDPDVKPKRLTAR